MAIRFLSILLLFFTTMQLNATTVVAPGGPFAIPDGDPAGIDIMFDFSGFNSQVSTLTLLLDMEHTWLGDISATLTSPGGEAQMVIFYRVGSGRESGFGDSTDLDGIYVFADFGDDMWLAAAGLDGNSSVPSGAYRTSTAGQPSLSNYGGHRTSLTGAFGDLISGSNGVSGEGVWVLNIADHVSPDSGTIGSASLTLDASDVIFSNGFETPLSRGTASAQGMPMPLPRNRMDFNGNGLADFGVLETSETPRSWRTLDNERDGNTGSEVNFDLGVGAFNTTWTSADFDGDGIADAASWDVLTAQYTIRRSARPGSTALNISIGVTGDDTQALHGDYDGDGIDDPVTFTNTGSTGEQRTLHYLRSSDGVSVSVLMGLDMGSDSTALGGEDFTGDGRADLLLDTAGNFEVRDGQTGAVVDTFTFGAGANARIMIGNFTGNNRADVTRVFLSGNDVIWQTRESGPGTILPDVILGEIGIVGFSEFAAAADYDGDGYQDYGVWRRDNATDDSAQFIFIPSAAPSTTTTVTFGSMNETPVVIGQSTL